MNIYYELIQFIILSLCLHEGFILLVGEVNYLLNARLIKWKIVYPRDFDISARPPDAEFNLDSSSESRLRCLLS